MATEGKFLAEMRALESLQDVMRAVDESRRLHEEAGMALPPMLVRFFAAENHASTSSDHRPRISVTPPPLPPRPHEAKDDWIAVPISELTTTTLLLGVLRESDGPMPAKTRLKRLQTYRPDVNLGSSLNVGARLEGGLIEKTDAGWKLTDATQAPLLYKGYAWGPIGVFQSPERTAHRREQIFHILRAAPGPMPALHIVRLMKDSQTCRIPVNSDAVKGDLKALRLEGKIRGVGRPRRWEIVPNE